MLFDLRVHRRDGCVVLAVVGELDLSVAPRIRQAVVRALAEDVRSGSAPPPDARPQVVLDLSGVHFLDSVGLGVVLGTVRRVRAGRGLIMIVTSEPVESLFAVLGLDRVLPTARSLEAALAGVTAGVGELTRVPGVSDASGVIDTSGVAGAVGVAGRAGLAGGEAMGSDG